MNEMIKKALTIAQTAHAGQKRKFGDGDYIGHPLSVYEIVKNKGHSDIHLMVALLHDVVEDTPWTLKQLKIIGFEQGVLCAVNAITRRMVDLEGNYADDARTGIQKEPYDQYLTRVLNNPIAKIVKVADVRHNISTLPKNKIGSTMHSKFVLTAWILESDGGLP